MTRNLNYLIARDIINIGIEDTTDFSYIIDFQSYMEKCDTEMKEYVTAHKKDIVVEIENETGKVANVEYDSSSEKIDMVFYTNAVMDRLEQKIYGSYQDDEELKHYATSEAKEFASCLVESKDFNIYLMDKIFNRREFEI